MLCVHIKFTLHLLKLGIVLAIQHFEALDSQALAFATRTFVLVEGRAHLGPIALHGARLEA